MHQNSIKSITQLPVLQHQMTLIGTKLKDKALGMQRRDKNFRTCWHSDEYRAFNPFRPLPPEGTWSPLLYRRPNRGDHMPQRPQVIFLPPALSCFAGCLLPAGFLGYTKTAPISFNATYFILQQSAAQLAVQCHGAAVEPSNES